MNLCGKEFRIKKNIPMRVVKKIRWAIADLSEASDAWQADRKAGDDAFDALEKQWVEIAGMLFDSTEGLPSFDEIGEDGFTDVGMGFFKRFSTQPK